MLRGRMQYAIQVAVVHSTMMFGASWAYGSGGGGGTGRVSGGKKTIEKTIEKLGVWQRRGRRNWQSQWR